jgi:hypothetical protein
MIESDKRDSISAGWVSIVDFRGHGNKTLSDFKLPLWCKWLPHDDGADRLSRNVDNYE